jgi:hypothetical protein
VTAASRTDERGELGVRYGQACAILSTKNCDAVLQQFETEIRSRAKIIISMSFNELERLAQADTNVFPTYHQRVQAGVQIPKGDVWDVLRDVVEHAVFPGYKGSDSVWSTLIKRNWSEELRRMFDGDESGNGNAPHDSV